MNEKEVAELRRRFKPEKSNITHIRGCYVNEQRQIISQFNQSLGMMTQEESEKFLGILKRTLSGGLGKNLLELTFSNQQVIDSEEHKLLMALRDSSLKDEEAVEALFQKAIQSVDLEGNYLILLAHDTYDVPYRGKDGEVQQERFRPGLFVYFVLRLPRQADQTGFELFGGCQRIPQPGSGLVGGAAGTGLFVPRL